MEKISGLSKIRMELTRFIEMFGDPVQNPMGWRKKLLSETAVIITGNTPSRADKNNYGTYLEWIKTDNITSNTFVTTASEYLSEEGAKKARIVDIGSILMACIAGS
ncbi:MAG: restriction endonuclease subunit S [Treponema sp.]|nr:restriction endonuclease subunit S [Treponema sp.]